MLKARIHAGNNSSAQGEKPTPISSTTALTKPATGEPSGNDLSAPRNGHGGQRESASLTRHGLRAGRSVRAAVRPGPCGPRRGYAVLVPCRASCRSFSPSLDSEVFSTVPPNLLIASTALSGVTFSTIKNSADVPGWSMPRT